MLVYVQPWYLLAELPGSSKKQTYFWSLHNSTQTKIAHLYTIKDHSPSIYALAVQNLQRHLLPFGISLLVYPRDSKEITKHLVLTSILTNYSDRKQPKPHKAPTQGIYSNNIKIVKKVCTQVIETSKEYGIYECIHTMASKTNLVQLNHAELNAINRDW